MNYFDNSHILNCTNLNKNKLIDLTTAQLEPLFIITTDYFEGEKKPRRFIGGSEANTNSC